MTTYVSFDIVIISNAYMHRLTASPTKVERS